MPEQAERAREISRTLRQALAQVAANISDLSLTEFVGLEPFETTTIDVSDPDIQSPNGREIFIQGGVGLAIQILNPTEGVKPPAGKVKIYINRPDGFSIDPRIDKILPIFPIVKLFVKAEHGTTGKFRIRVFKDPMFLYTVSPESTGLGEVQIQNAVGTVINPATEDTLAGGIKIKNASGTVINPATEDTLAGGIKIKNASGTVINPATNELFVNRSSAFSKQYSVGTSVVTGDNQPVPDGKYISIWADPDNTSEVALTFDGSTTPVVGTHAGLKAGQGIAVALTNVNKIKMIAASGTQKVNIVVEV